MLHDEQKEKERFDLIRKSGGHVTVSIDGLLSCTYRPDPQGDLKYGFASVTGIGCADYPHGQKWLADAISAGCLVIDLRPCQFKDVSRVAISGPMLAEGIEPDAAPYGALSYAPLAHWLKLRRDIGAIIHNAPREQ